MRSIVDECTGHSVARWLREQKHDVYSVYDESRGMNDDDILKKAFDENWILITNDKDFGEMVFKEKRPHKGVVYLRLEDEISKNKIETLKRLLWQMLYYSLTSQPGIDQGQALQFLNFENICNYSACIKD